MVPRRYAVVFPGQGSQFVGMAPGFAQPLLSEASQVLGRDLGRLCQAGPAELLDDTENAQPVMFTVDVAYWRELAPNLSGLPAFMAGHSLGEYAAYCAAGALGFADSLELVERRAAAMARASKRRPGGMMAVIGLSLEQVDEALSGLSDVSVANHNSPAQIVISGTREALVEASAALMGAGAKKTVPLKVSGPFHSSLMAKAAEAMAGALESAALTLPAVPVVSNVLARPASDQSELRASLVTQITGKVRWQESIEYMAEHGVETFVEVGPGKVLAGLIKRIFPEASVFSAGSYEDLGDLAAALADLAGG